MYINKKMIIAKSGELELSILPKMANRHGIITGATGTGKTVTVKVLAESFSKAGVPTFVADIKGDLSGTAEMGELNENVEKRKETLKLEGFDYEKFPVRFWDVYGNKGHRVRAKVDSFDASLLSRILELSDSQEGNLQVALRIARDENKPIINFENLKQILKYTLDNKDRYASDYGNITSQSINTVMRKLLEFENKGANIFFNEPELELKDLTKYDISNGYGFINILDATELSKDYNLYSTLMLWLLNELYDKLPEVGDLEKPKLVLFIDEAHMLFDEMNSSMLKKITQIVKLIRSKGVGLYFISQSPSDIPEEILSQLGNRIQHNLKAYTPSEMKAVKVAAQSFRVNPNFDSEKAILELSTGEALVSFINEDGQPSVVERGFILPPQSKMGVINEVIRTNIVNSSEMKNKYDIEVQNRSFEITNEQPVQEQVVSQVNQTVAEAERELTMEERCKRGITPSNNAINQSVPVPETPAPKKTPGRPRQSTTEKITNQIQNKMINKATTKVTNSIWKALFK